MKIDKILKSIRISAILALFGLISLQPVFSQNGTVRGTVSDGSGTPLQGATVMVKGTSNGVVSDAEGKYQLSNVPAGKDAVLQVSYVGYINKEVAVGSQTVINIILEEDAQMFEEVVVVGYGTRKKASLTGSVSTMNVNEIRSIPVGNLSNALAGRISGVTVTNTAGGVPGSSANIVVRARGTWNSVDPLYVIDGVVRDKRAFDMLSSSDIESFSILKDAAAASVYGARAANGVVLITSKKGKEGKPVISYSGSMSVGEFAYEPQRETVEQRIRVTNIGQMEYRNVLGSGKSIDENGYHPAFTSIYRNGVDASDGYISSGVFSDEARAYYSDPAHHYDRLDEVYRAPVTNSHALSVSGGSEAIKYYMGANFYDETGIFKSNDYEKYSVRSSMDAKINRRLTASLALNLDNSLRTTPTGEDMGNMYYFLQRSPRLFPGIANGKYVINKIGATDAGNDHYSFAAIANGEAGLTKDQYWNAEYTASLQWEIPWIKGLTAKALYNNYARHRLQKAQAIPYQVYLLNNNPADTGDPLGIVHLPEVDESTVHTKGSNYLNQYNSLSKNYQLNGIINYNNTFGKHEVGAMLAYEQVESYGESSSGQKEDFVSFSRPYLDFGTSDKTKWGLGGSGSESGRISYVGSFSYAYAGKYLADFAFREDLSSNFDPLHRKGFFPSGSVAWRISEEGFIKNKISFLDNLKLRGAIGLTGNDNVGAFQWLDRANTNAGGFYYGGDAATKGVSLSSIANPLISWEKSLNYNGGIEIGLFKMFTLEANYFFRKTYDILGSQTANIPDTFGASLSSSNYGKVNSFGFDLELGFNKHISKDLDVWAKGIFGWADNELVEYAEPEGTKPWLSKLGMNWDRMAGTLTDGIVQQMYKIGEQNEKGTDLYRVVTSTGNTYIVPADYYQNDVNKYINSGHEDSFRPGWIFIRDLRGQDADGNPTGPDGYAIDNSSFDHDWSINHLFPPYNYSLLLGGNWKGLALEVFLQGTGGNQRGAMYHNGANTLWNGTTWGYWAEDSYSVIDNPTGKYPILTNPAGGGTNANHFWVRDASFVRLKSVTLSYDLPKKILSKLGVADTRIFITGYNLALLWTNMEFADPELGERSGTNNPSWNPNSQDSPNNGVATYPLMRTVTIGLNISF